MYKRQGETTWGKVFLNNGLQLVIAVLLIVLGLTIVINSMTVSYTHLIVRSRKFCAQQKQRAGIKR